MAEKWTVYNKGADFTGLARKLGVSPVIVRLLRNKDLTTEKEMRDFLFAGEESFLDPASMKGLPEASGLLKKKIAEGKKIRVCGDYDVDGIMSSYILTDGLSRLGADADTAIPDRMKDGYGLSTDMVEKAFADGTDTIVTCDNGVSAWDSIALAKEKGMTVIVTDHHEVSRLPDADVVADPKQPGDGYENKAICGAGVAYKLMKLMLGEDADRYLPFAAFATVCDVVDLLGENRAMVSVGLRMLRATDHVGISALCRACGIEKEKIRPYDIGFVLGPCLNASGRLESAMAALGLMTETDPARADETACSLRELNEERKALTEKGIVRAEEIIESEGLSDDKVLVVYIPELHESICGIVAGRLKDKYTRPVIVLAKGEEHVKGSGRSVEGFDLFEGLNESSEFLQKYGGHALAAGLSLDEDKIGAFAEKINGVCDLGPDDLARKVRIDMVLPLSFLSEELVDEIRLLEPFGKGNARPVFALRRANVDRLRSIGNTGRYFRCRVTSSEPEDRPRTEGGGPASAEAVIFAGEGFAERVAEDPAVSLTYEPEINEFRGRRTLQIRITHFQ